MRQSIVPPASDRPIATVPCAPLAGACVAWAMALCMGALALGSLGLFVGVAVGGWLAGAASALALLVAVAMAVRRRRGLAPFALVAAGAAASVALAGAAVDIAYDGMSYHQVSVIALAAGWNPVRVPHVVDWWVAAHPESAWLGRTLAAGGQWSDHYPRASWMLGAMAVAATGMLDTSKWLQPFLAGVAALAAFRAWRGVAMPAWQAAITAVTAALSPVAVAQMGTNLVDGLAGSALLIAAAAGLSWERERRAGDLFATLAACVLAVNLKFTTAVYAVALAVLILGLGLRRQGPSRGEAAALLLGAAALVVASAGTYGHNLLAHGHPFYPLDRIDIVAGHAPPAFLARTRVEKLALSLFLQVPGQQFDLAHVGVVSPRLWHYKAIMVGPEKRVGGFGLLFGWSLLPAAAALVAAGVRLRRRAGGAAVPLAGLVAWCVLCVAVNPESWWARYVPQFWLVPILASVLAFAAGLRRISLVVLAAPALGAALAGWMWVAHEAELVAHTRRDLVAAAARGGVTILDGVDDNEGVFTFVHRMAEAGVAVRLGTDAARCTTRFGLVAICAE